MDQRKVNKEEENKRLEEFRRKLADELTDKLSRAQKVQLMSGVRYMDMSGTKDVCIVKLRVNWKNVFTWIIVSFLVIGLISIGLVFSPFIVAGVIYEAIKRVLGEQVVDCVAIPEIGEGKA